jgi:hypothetical protein
MMVILALMMAPRIAVATSLAHFTPRPTWPLWSPAAKVPDADVAVLGRCGNVPDVLGWTRSGIRMAPAGSKAAATRTDDDERLEARALAGAGLLLHGHDLHHLPRATALGRRLFARIAPASRSNSKRLD